MARPQKKGLEYFPLDVDMDSDEKVAYVIAKYDFTAFGLIVKLYMEIYRRGYFLIWDERQTFLLKRQLGLDVDYIVSVVHACVKGEIFDEALFREYSVLTSHGIQQRYLQATGRRVNIKMAPEICLLDAEEIKTAKVEFTSSKLLTKKPVSDAETHISVDGNTRKQEENSIPTASQQKPQFPHTETPVSVAKTDFGQKSEADENGQKPVSDAETPVSAYRNPVLDDITSAESTQSKVKYIIDDDDDKGRGKNDSDKQFAEIAKTFSDNIHPISGEIEKDKLTDLYEHYGYKWCMEAIKETALNHGRSIKYIERVLDDWERNGFKAPRASKGGAKRGGNGGTRRKVEVEGIDDFDEAEERQKQNRPWDVQPQPRGDGTP